MRATAMIAPSARSCATSRMPRASPLSSTATPTAVYETRAERRRRGQKMHPSVRSHGIFRPCTRLAAKAVPWNIEKEISL